MEFFNCKYKFHDVVDNQIKNYKMFSPMSQFKYRGFEFANPKRTTVIRTVIDDERKNIKYSLEWERKGFDLNALYVFDKSKDRFCVK